MRRHVVLSSIVRERTPKRFVDPRAGYDPAFLLSESSVRPVRRSRNGCGALAGRRSQAVGVRNRCSATELQARGRGGGNRTLTVVLKARCSTFELHLRVYAVVRFNSRSVLSLFMVSLVVPSGVEPASQWPRRLQRQSPSEDEPRDQKRKKPPRFPWVAFT